MAKRRSSDECEAGNSLKKDGSEHFTDLDEVLQLLRKHGYSGVSYYNLGLCLGLSPTTLDVIRENERNVESCLRECLTKWLQKADGVQKKGGPTIYSLISALRKLGENGVADGIDMEKHPACKILARCSAQQSLVSALPQLILLLHAAKLIKEMILPPNVQGEDLLIEIKEAVCNDYQILKAFAKILREVTATAEIGSTIMKEYREVYRSDDSLQANDANELEIYLPKNVTSEFKLMRLSLGQTFFKVGSIMMNNPQSPSIDNIKSVLRTYDKALRPQVAQCQDIREVLELVCDNCQLDDISMLEFFVHELNIEEAKPVIQEYKEAIEKLKEIKLSQYLNETFSHASPLKCERITIFVDEDVNQSVLNDVKRLSSAAFQNLSRHIKLNVVKEGNSFTITCSFPLILSEQLIRAALNNIDVLKENKVKRLTIGYCTVYEVKDTSTPTATEIDEYTSSLSTSSGLMKQLMLSLSVQLINSTEEQIMTIKEEVESLKGTLDIKNKMLTASIAESDKFKKIAAETKQLLQEKVSHLTEREKENQNLKKIKEILEEQLALFQSEKAVEKHEETQMQTVSHWEENEAIQMSLALRKELKEKDEEMEQKQAESKKEIEVLRTNMHLQRIELDKKVQELKLKIKNLEKAFPKEKHYQENDTLKEIKEILEEQLALFQSENEDGKQLVAVIEKLAETNKAKEQLYKENNEDAKLEQITDENKKLEQLMLSQNEYLIKREQKLNHLIEEMQNLQAQVEQLSNDEELHIELSILRKQSLSKQKQDPNPIIFQDDIYGEIFICHPLIKRIVKTRQFQRLRHIKKLGYTYQNISKASYSRFQHSIGMYYFAGKYVKQLRKKNSMLITESEVLCIQIAALCYNLGHGPFSHIFRLFLDEVSPKPWEKVSEASVQMFDYMIEENDEVKELLEECLDDYEEDIAFIKDLMHDAYGSRKVQRKGKEFLHEIVVNKTSGLDVCMIDYTTRDAAALGKNINFKWRVFISTVSVKEYKNGERHICFQEDDLEIYNDLFRTRHSLFRELFYVRKNRMAALMITRILVKSSNIPIIRNGDRLVNLYEATQSMSAYTQLNDGTLNVIKSYVDDPEVQHLLSSLESMKFIGQIGYVVPRDEWHTDKIKQHIVYACTENIADYLIIDPIKSGYENHFFLKQHYYTSDGSTGQWTHEWANPPENIYPTPVRIFLVSGNRNLIKKVQEVLQNLLKMVPLTGGIYSEQENLDLMPPLPPTVIKHLK